MKIILSTVAAIMACIAICLSRARSVCAGIKKSVKIASRLLTGHLTAADTRSIQPPRATIAPGRATNHINIAVTRGITAIQRRHSPGASGVQIMRFATPLAQRHFRVRPDTTRRPIARHRAPNAQKMQKTVRQVQQHSRAKLGITRNRQPQQNAQIVQPHRHRRGPGIIMNIPMRPAPLSV